MSDLNVTDGDRERAREFLGRLANYGDPSMPLGAYESDAEALAAEFAKVREECARVAERVVPRHTECGMKIAAAIRGQGKQEKKS